MLNQPLTDAELLEVLQEEIDPILEEEGSPPRRVSIEDQLDADLALKSLALARLVAALEVRTGADPFQELVSITSIRTIGDLVDAYSRYWAGGGAEKDAEELLAAQRRAIGRKNERGGGI